ncbi:hypothetical protein VDR77_21285 [Xanthomonas campestris pv. campestris]|nr:hypothetical protein [Xanthomonas campestris pv. campestris]
MLGFENDTQTAIALKKPMTNPSSFFVLSAQDKAKDGLINGVGG